MAMTDSRAIESQRAQLRDVNERVARLLDGDDEIVSLLCECASGFCVEQVPMRRSQFDAIERDGCLVLAPGHRV